MKKWNWVFLLGLLVQWNLAAQTPAEPKLTQAVSLNGLSVALWSIYEGTYEIAVLPQLTVQVSARHTPGTILGDHSYSLIHGGLGIQFYPEQALSGPYVGVSAVAGKCVGEYRDETISLVTRSNLHPFESVQYGAGIQAGYKWQMGAGFFLEQSLGYEYYFGQFVLAQTNLSRSLSGLQGALSLGWGF